MFASSVQGRDSGRDGEWNLHKQDFIMKTLTDEKRKGGGGALIFDHLPSVGFSVFMSVCSCSSPALQTASEEREKKEIDSHNQTIYDQVSLWSIWSDT